MEESYSVPPIDRAKLKSFKELSSIKSNPQPYSSRRRQREKEAKQNQIHLVTACHHFDAFKKYRVLRESKTGIKGHIFKFSISESHEKSDHNENNNEGNGINNNEGNGINNNENNNDNENKAKKIINYYAKFKSRPLGEYIAISNSSDVHLSAKAFTAVLLHANNLCDFSLRLNERYGEEVISLQFSLSSNDDGVRAPRSLTVFVFGQQPENGDLPKRLTNLAAVETVNGEWNIDLGDGDAIGSIKNCTLVDEHKKPQIYVRKVDNDALEIEAIERFDGLRLFAIGIAAFLCKIY